MSATSALDQLVDHLRGDPVISPHVRPAEADPGFGRLVATGPRAAEAPEEYALLVEAVREGYLLHYSEPRIVDGTDRDLSLLAGDYLYALGLERLAIRGDLAAVDELADLISLCAQLHARGDEAGRQAAEALWLAAVTVVGAGGDDAHEAAKELLRAGRAEEGARELIESACVRADASGMGGELAAMAEQVGFAIPERG